MFNEVLFAFTVTIHNFLIFGTILFAICRILFFKNTPYSAFYIGLLGVVQSIYSSCPVTDINNFFAKKSGTIPIVENSFWFGIFDTYEIIAKLCFLIIAGIFINYAWKNWYKVDVVVDFSRIWKKHNFQMPAVNKI